MKKIAPLLLTAVLLSACLPGNVQVPQSPLLPFLERKAGLIVYIGADWNIYTSDQAGGHVTAYTTDAKVPENTSDSFHYYVYPTWSPDGDSIAFVGVAGQSTPSSSDVYVAAAEDKAKKVFSSNSEHPIYLYWSPDNTNLGFLSTTTDGQSMILQSVSSENKERTVIDTGTPYYWSWAPDGKTMIVHTGSTQSTAPDHLAFLKVGSDITEDGIDTTAATFQSPAWSTDGQHILMTRINDQKKQGEIIVTDGRGKFEKAIGTFDLNTAFAWSHQSDMVAYIEGKQTISAGTLGTLHVVDLANTKEVFKDEEDVYAFFWSPNDRKIAYFIPRLSSGSSSSSGQSDSNAQAQQELVLILKMLDVDTGENKELFTFRPSDQFAAILPYFDQYHQSATIWSPDSNNLVLSFTAQDGTPGIAVVAASGQLEPRVLKQGYLAFWSPK